MTCNVGGIDRIARIIVGIGLIVLALLHIGAPWTWIGVVPLVTGAIGWCPAYPMIGFNTRKS